MLHGSAMRTWQGPTAVCDSVDCEEILCLFACHNTVQTFFVVCLSRDNFQQNYKQC